VYGRRGATGLLDLLFSTLDRRSVAPDQCLDFCTASVLSDERGVLGGGRMENVVALQTLPHPRGSLGECAVEVWGALGAVRERVRTALFRRLKRV